MSAKMGGAGGYTCLSDSANQEIKEFIEMYNDLENYENRFNHIQMACLAKGHAMTQAGIITPHIDPALIYEELKTAPTESLR